MAFIMENSKEGYQPNLNLFTAAPVETATENVQWQEFRPTGQVTKGSSIEFAIPGRSSNYTDLKQTRLYVKAKIVNEGRWYIDNSER